MKDCKNSSSEYCSRLPENTPESAKLPGTEVLTGEEKERIISGFNNTKADYPADKTIHEMFEEQVAKSPESITAIFPDKSLTYSELNKRANQLGLFLRGKGVKPDSIVGIMAERSPEMMVGIMAILKAGGAYLPIEPGYPPERIKFLLEDSGAGILLTQQQWLEKVQSGVELVNLNDESIYGGDGSNLEKVNTSKDLVYVIYTSGSTGKPKGVMIEHHSLVNRINWMQKEYPIDSSDVILQKTTFVFDVSVWELFWWSTQGARVCFLQPGKEKDPRAIVKAVEKNMVTTIHFVPSILSIFLEYIESRFDLDRLKSLRRVFASGEALNLHQVEKFNSIFYKRNTRLHNLYGPTEATIDVTYFDCSKEGLDVVPIGRPIDNIRLYILDEGNMLQPVGVPGELHIAGVGLARGYVNRPELNAEKFIPNPFEEGSKLYKTGDLAKWLPDGNVVFLGRLDNQVKIRGLRIELGEIEAQLLDHHCVKEAVVLVKEGSMGNKYLCACVTADKGLQETELKAYLTERLPDYMIPSSFHILERLPLTANGKVDRKALAEYTAVQGQIE